MRSQVYFIPGDRKEDPKTLSKKMEKLYLALGLNGKIDKGDFVALKIHFGERGNTGYIKPDCLEKTI
jgi:uncharacterized Fe-S center protein